MFFRCFPHLSSFESPHSSRRWLREDASNRGRGSNLERRLAGNTGNLRTFLFGASAKPETTRVRNVVPHVCCLQLLDYTPVKKEALAYQVGEEKYDANACFPASRLPSFADLSFTALLCHASSCIACSISLLGEG